MTSMVASTRPPSVTLAVVLSVLAILGNIAGFALPTGGEAPPLFIVVSSIILSVAAIPAAIGLWLMRRWGFILTIVVTALNLLATLPGIPAGPTVTIKVFSAVFAVLCVVILVVVLLPDTRRVYR